MCRGWGGGHVSLLSSPMGMLSYKFSSLSCPLTGRDRRTSGKIFVLNCINLYISELIFIPLSLTHIPVIFPSCHLPSFSLLFPPAHSPGVGLTVPCHVILAASSGSTLLETGHDTPTAPPPRHPSPHTHKQTHTTTPVYRLKMASAFYWQHWVQFAI